MNPPSRFTNIFFFFGIGKEGRNGENEKREGKAGARFRDRKGMKRDTEVTSLHI